MAKATLSTLKQTLAREYERHGRSIKHPELWVMSVYRFGRWSQDLGGVSESLCSKAYGALSLGMLLATGCTIHREAELGDGFHLVHIGNVKIHPDTKVGKNVGVMQEVTLGTSPGRAGAPVIEDDVFIGAGAKILGPVHIGKGARIAANSLVLQDVPAGATAIGVPARVLRYTGRSSTPPAPQATADNSPALTHPANH